MMYNNMTVDTFVIPWMVLISYLLINGFAISFSFYLLRQLKFYNKSINDKIIILVVFIIGSLVMGLILASIESVIIDGMLAKNIQSYLALRNLINFCDIIASIANGMFIIVTAVLIVLKIHDGTKYDLPSIKKEYKASDSILSFCNAMFLGIPGLLFQIIWLLDAKSDNVYRFKKMRFWYIIGMIIPIIVYGFLILVKIVEYLA